MDVGDVSMAVLVVLGSAFVFAELAGYAIHLLLHSEKVPFLSRNHMLHHLRDYGPGSGLRSDRYLYSTGDRAGFLGTGLEWLLPVGTLLVVLLGVFRWVGVEPRTQAIFVSASLTWGWLALGYMHDAMHVRHFWMQDVPFLRSWFRGIRKRHDIHHLELSDDGRMVANYGICFFFLDRLFGTYSARHRPFNRAGYEAAKRRYAFIFLASSAGGSRG